MMRGSNDTVRWDGGAYFAASNSRAGFHSYYEACFRNKVDTLYIIKGGPGTGKSALMRALAQASATRGYRAEYVYCSSDPDSLDAVLLYGKEGKSVGFLDGTAPHLFEVSMPGVREELIDLGVFWSHKALSAREREIAALSDQKKQQYLAAYRYLAMAGECMDLMREGISACLDAERVRRLVRRLTGGITASTRKESECRIALREAIGMRGWVSLPTYERTASTLCYLLPHYGMEYEVLSEILRTGLARGADICVSYHPVCPDRINALYFPDAGISFLPADKDSADHPDAKRVDLRRLLIPAHLGAQRGEIRRAACLYREAIEGTCHHMQAVADAHFALEGIYSSAMDFDAKEAYTEALIERVL